MRRFFRYNVENCKCKDEYCNEDIQLAVDKITKVLFTPLTKTDQYHKVSNLSMKLLEKGATSSLNKTFKIGDRVVEYNDRDGLFHFRIYIGGVFDTIELLDAAVGLVFTFPVRFVIDN